MDAQLKKGLLDVCVLAVLRRGESYGYKIIADVAPYIEISESTLYPILKRLESSGAVTAHSACAAHQPRRSCGLVGWLSRKKGGGERTNERREMSEVKGLSDRVLNMKVCACVQARLWRSSV